MTVEMALPALGSLLRKAAVDAGFDLEPDIDGAWWRLRASGAPGVAWVRPTTGLAGAWLALPIAEQLAVALGTAPAPLSGISTVSISAALPAGAAGAVTLATAEALHDALRRVWAYRAHTPERLAARWEAAVAAALGGAVDSTSGETSPDGASALTTTEVVASVRRRVGQDIFREALLDLWEGRCAVTGLAVPELLRASHAKPWAVATDSERLDRYNGLLLAVHLDVLFDQGFLTFDENGQGRWSSALPMSATEILGLSEMPPTLRWVDVAHQKYLAWHRSHVFRSLGKV
jgi:putative restriction endonuclease